MTNHTPGPWHRNIRANGHYPVVYAGRNQHVATISRNDPEEMEANIDLIAAAPDLLAALVDMIDMMGPLDDIEMIRRKQVALKAIAKAKGQ